VSEEKPKTGSWLIRCWEEPTKQSQDDPVVRGFVRDLKTGKERYVSDPRELGEILAQEMREAGETPEGEREVLRKRD
jgi:hypothetical protein